MVLPHRLIDLVAQEIPDLFQAADEVGIGHALEAARAANIDRDNALDDSRSRAHDRHPVAAHHRFLDVMRDQDHRLFFLLPNAQKLFAQEQPRLRIQAGKGLIHKNDFRVVGQGSGNRHLLLHPAGQLSRMGGAEIEEPHHLQPKPGNLLVYRHGLLAKLRPQRDIAFHGPPRHQSRILKDHGYHCLSPFFPDEFYRTFGRLFQPGDDMEQSGLAASGRADHAEKFPVPDFEIHSSEGLDPSLPCHKLLGQPVNHYTHGLSSPSPENLVKELNVAIKVVVDIRRSNRRTNAFNQPRRIGRGIDAVGNPPE